MVVFIFLLIIDKKTLLTSFIQLREGFYFLYFLTHQTSLFTSDILEKIFIKIKFDRA